MFLPEAELHTVRQFADGFIREDDEQLVGRRLKEEWDLPLMQPRFQKGCRLKGMSADSQIKVIGEERVELDACNPSFSHQCPMLLDDSEEMGNQLRVGHDNRLTEQSSAFRAADIEGIAEFRQILQTDIVLRTCQ